MARSNVAVNRVNWKIMSKVSMELTHIGNILATNALIPLRVKMHYKYTKNNIITTNGSLVMNVEANVTN